MEFIETALTTFFGVMAIAALALLGLIVGWWAPLLAASVFTVAVINKARALRL